MKTHPSLFRDLIHYLSGRAALLFLGFFTFPLMTRMLSVSQYGLVSLTFRIILLLTVLSKCGLQYSAARFYDGQQTENSLDQQRRFYSTLILGPLLTSLAIFVVYLPVLLTARKYLLDTQLYRCLIIAPILILLRTLQTILLSFLRNEGRSLLHSGLEVTTKLLTLAALLALLFGGLRSAFSILVATALSEALIVLVQLGMLLRRDVVRPSAIDWYFIRTSLLFGAPLIAYELSSLVLDSGDRLLVRHYLGNLALGYYSAAYNISSYLQETLMTPLNLAIVPIYIRLWNDRGPDATQNFLSTALSWFIGAIFVVSFMALLGSQKFLVIIASQKFSEAGRLLPIIIPGLMLYATHIFLNVGMILQKKTGLMAGLVFVSAVTNILLNIFLIPRRGISGAAWANLWSYLLLILLMAAVNQRLLPLRLNIGIIWRVGLSAGLAYISAAQIHFASSIGSLGVQLSAFTFLTTLFLALLSRDFRMRSSAFCHSVASSIGLKGQFGDGRTPLIEKISIVDSYGGEP